MLNEDKPHDNLNNTTYRNQMNKVANAVKEIITALKKHTQKNKEDSIESIVKKPKQRFSRSTKIIVITVLIAALIVLGVLFIPKLFKSSETVDKSIAVLPFENLSNDPEQDYFSDGMVEAILDRLFKVGDLEVISSTSTKRYRRYKASLEGYCQRTGCFINPGRECAKNRRQSADNSTA